MEQFDLKVEWAGLFIKLADTNETILYVAGMSWSLAGACWDEDEIRWLVDGARQFVGRAHWSVKWIY